MYRGLEGELTKLQYAAEAVGDILGGVKSLVKAGDEKYFEKRYGDNRINKKFGLKMEMSGEK
jgi:hypothetical protein